jgi:NAD+ synthase
VARTLEHLAWLQRHFPNVSVERVDLTPAFDTLVRELPGHGGQAIRDLVLANTRARLRMTTLYFLAGIHRALVAGTGNKVEDFGVGFFTKYGDGGVDLSPIGDLTKSEVHALAEALGIVESIRKAKPSDGLFADDRSDEDQLGATYPELEWAMALRETGQNAKNLTERQQQVLAIYDRLHAANAHKWEPIPVCVLPEELRGA